MKVVYCQICRKLFETKTTGKFCSDECRKIKKSESNKVHHEKYKESINDRLKKNYRNNPNYYRERDRKKRERLRLLNPDSRVNRNLSHLSLKERKVEIRKKFNIHRKSRYANDELYAIETRFRSLLNKKIREGGFVKSERTLEYLGCSWEFFKDFIQSKFLEGMNWNNRHDWDLDHIIPISEAKCVDDVKLLSHFSNFQPLWKIDNVKKSNKW